MVMHMTSPKESVLAQCITQAKGWQRIIFEHTRKRWMVYGKPHPGVWSEVDEEVITKAIFTALGKHCPEGFSSGLLDGVTKLIKIRRGRTLKPPSRDYLPYRNKVLHIPTMETLDHDSRARLYVVPALRLQPAGHLRAYHRLAQRDH
jgi:hypothetical protein